MKNRALDRNWDRIVLYVYTQMNISDEDKSARKVRAGLSIGPIVIAMGTSIAALSIAAHNPVAKLIIMGAAILIMIMGIIISVINIAKMKIAKAMSA